MAEPENPIESADIGSAVADPDSLHALQQQVQSLRALLHGALMALLLLSVGVCIYLYRQDDLVTKELTIARTVVRDYEDNKESLLKTFISKLQEYAQAHPDFNPILDKYGLRSQPGASPLGGQLPSVAPAPAPAKTPR